MSSLLQIFKDLPWWAKAVLTFGVVVFGVSIHDLANKNPEVLSSLTGQNIKSLTRVNITVLNRQNSQPVGDVRAQIIFEGPPVSAMTDRGGYFEIQIPSRKTAQITLTKTGFIPARDIINLEADPNTTKVLFIDPLKDTK